MFSLSLSPVKEAIVSLCSESAGAGARHCSDGHQAVSRQLGLNWCVNYHVPRYLCQCKATRLIKIINSNSEFVFYKLFVNFSKLHEERERSLGYYIELLINSKLGEKQRVQWDVRGSLMDRTASEAENLADLYFDVETVFGEWDIGSGDESCCAANCHTFTASSHSLEQF